AFEYLRSNTAARILEDGGRNLLGDDVLGTIGSGRQGDVELEAVAASPEGGEKHGKCHCQGKRPADHASHRPPPNRRSAFSCSSFARTASRNGRLRKRS